MLRAEAHVAGKTWAKDLWPIPWLKSKDKLSSKEKCPLAVLGSSRKQALQARVSRVEHAEPGRARNNMKLVQTGRK